MWVSHITYEERAEIQTQKLQVAGLSLYTLNPSVFSELNLEGAQTPFKHTFASQ